MVAILLITFPMKQRLHIEMAVRVWLILLILLTGARLASADSAPPLYHQVAGGVEELEVAKPTTINRIALERGLRWPVVARQNGLKKPF